MSSRDGFECYKLYLAMQRHFSSGYDFFKYNGKVNVAVETYHKRNDVFAFEKLSNIVPSDERLDFLLSHCIEDPKMWIRNMSKMHYDKYKQRMKNFPKTFKEDLEFLSQRKPSHYMSTKNGIPPIHEYCMTNKISLETLIAIDNFFPFIDQHDEEVDISIGWPDYIEKVKNYRPFLQPKINSVYQDIMRNVLLD